MIRFKDLFAVVWAILCLIGAYTYGILGANWLDENIGHGLNPWIAFPLMLVCLGLALATKDMRQMYIEFFESDEERIQREFLEMREALRKHHDIHI